MKKSDDMIERGIRSNRRFIYFWIFIFIMIFSIIAGVLLGQTRVDKKGETKTMKVKALTCKSDHFFYPFLEFDETTKKEFKIITTFTEKSVRSISLQQMLYYENEEKVKESEARNHAAMNIQYGEDGMEADALGASYARLSNGLRFGLFSNFEKLNEKEYKYYLLEGISSLSYEGIKQAYEKLGLECNDN